MSRYQLMPELAPEDFMALKADIADRGVLVPVEYDEDGNILDGHHRVRACEQLGLKEWPRIIRSGMSEADKREHARNLNLARRQLTREQKRSLIASQLKETPEKSNRQLAEALGVDHKTVSTVRAEGEARGEIPHVSETTDTLGRQQPARKAIRTAYIDPAATTQRKPLVTHNSGREEWYTPPEIIDRARRVLGGIEFDPASSPLANETVQAAKFFTAEDDALEQEWPVASIFMNPPYTASVIAKFVKRFCETVADGATGIALTNNATETRWFHDLLNTSTALCLPKRRLRFINPDQPTNGSVPQGQAIFYAGPDRERFAREFGDLGPVIDPRPLGSGLLPAPEGDHDQ